MVSLVLPMFFHVEHHTRLGVVEVDRVRNGTTGSIWAVVGAGNGITVVDGAFSRFERECHVAWAIEFRRSIVRYGNRLVVG